jgi:hypothetical protein
VPLLASVSPCTLGSRLVSVHTAVQLHNDCGLDLALALLPEGGAAAPAGPPVLLGRLAAGESQWLPVQVLARASPGLVLQPLPSDPAATTRTYGWCSPLDLAGLLPAGAPAPARPASRVGSSQQRQHRQVLTFALAEELQHQHQHLLPASGTLTICLGVTRGQLAGSWTACLQAPARITNALPVPLEVSLLCGRQEHSAVHAVLAPAEQLPLYDAAPGEFLQMQVQPLGHCSSQWLPLGSGGGVPPGGQQQEPVMVQVASQHAGQPAQALAVGSSFEAASGQLRVRVGCALWLYNCTAYPLALRQVEGDGLEGPGALEASPPALLVPPYEPPHPLTAPQHAGGASLAASGSRLTLASTATSAACSSRAASVLGYAGGVAAGGARSGAPPSLAALRTRSNSSSALTQQLAAPGSARRSMQLPRSPSGGGGGRARLSAPGVASPSTAAARGGAGLAGLAGGHAFAGATPRALAHAGSFSMAAQALAEPLQPRHLQQQQQQSAPRLAYVASAGDVRVRRSTGDRPRRFSADGSDGDALGLFHTPQHRHQQQQQHPHHQPRQHPLWGGLVVPHLMAHASMLGPGSEGASRPLSPHSSASVSGEEREGGAGSGGGGVKWQCSWGHVGEGGALPPGRRGFPGMLRHPRMRVTSP